MAYDCQLVKVGYRVYHIATRDKNVCWGVSTLEKKILLYNIPHNFGKEQMISDFLWQADYQYKTEWKK